MSVNVNRGLSDQFYRYKMPKLIAKVEGKGNGIKTVIVNMVEVAKALNRPPMYPTKYFGCILGAQTNYDVKTDRYIVNGSHEAARLQDLLDGFIQKYVLCPSCSNPETVLKVSQSKGIIGTSCKACGYAGTINSKDKLTTYIIKFPPETPASTDKKEGKESKGKKSAKKSTKKETNGSSSPKHDSDEAEEEAGSPSGNNNHEKDEEDEDWCEDTDADAVAKRMEELLSVGAKGLMQSNDLEKSTEERLMMFLDFVKKRKETAGEGFDVQTQKDIVSEANRLDVKDKAVLALCEGLFDENLLSQLKSHRMLFLRVSFLFRRKLSKTVVLKINFVFSSRTTTLMPRSTSCEESN